MSTTPVIIPQLARPHEEHNQTPTPPSDQPPPLDYGLDSLGFTADVARLEDQLNIDLVTSDEQVDDAVTLGDFIAAYDRLAE
jgi:acyl carrier protein